MSSHADRWPFGYDVQAIMRPWLDGRKQWQDILDRSLPTSLIARRAQEQIDYIDGQLARLNSPREALAGDAE